jgi:hypothetical protein
MEVLSRPQPLYLPLHPVSWALDRIDTALHDIRTASVTGWRSVLADTYRDELDDLTGEITRVRDLALSAEQSYSRLRHVATLNGEQ